MPKYQIILSSNENLTDQEFQQHIEHFLMTSVFGTNFKLVYAQNLEEIKKELWEKKEEVKQDICAVGDAKDPFNKESNDQLIETTFEDIQKLFKLED
jgi:hypothetical protein